MSPMATIDPIQPAGNGASAALADSPAAAAGASGSASSSSDRPTASGRSRAQNANRTVIASRRTLEPMNDQAMPSQPSRKAASPLPAIAPNW